MALIQIVDWIYKALQVLEHFTTLPKDKVQRSVICPLLSVRYQWPQAQVDIEGTDKQFQSSVVMVVMVADDYNII